MIITQESKVIGSGVYFIRNKKTKKCYIGSAVNIHTRIFGTSSVSHIKALVNKDHINKKLQNAWNKYGAEAFEYEVLEFCNKDLLIKREQYYLDILLTAKDPKKFAEKAYNICPTAGSPLGRKASLSTKKRISVCKTGSKNPMYGKIDAANPRSKRILQYDVTGVFIKEWSCKNVVEKELGIKASNISNAIKRQQLSGGYYWRYHTQEYKNAIAVKGPQKKSLKAYNMADATVLCFATITEAAEHFSISKGSFWSGVQRNLDGKTKHYKNYQWSYT